MFHYINVSGFRLTFPFILLFPQEEFQESQIQCKYYRDHFAEQEHVIFSLFLHATVLKNIVVEQA